MGAREGSRRRGPQAEAEGQVLLAGGWRKGRMKSLRKAVCGPFQARGGLPPPSTWAFLEGHLLTVAGLAPRADGAPVPALSTGLLE